MSLPPLMSLAVKVGAPTTVDTGTPGRRFIPIVGGEVSGGFTGRVLEGGGDWQTVRADGTLEISAHYIVEIDDQGPVEINSDGVRHASPEILAALGRGEDVDPATYYFRTAVRFRTSAPGLMRLNHTLAVSTGRRAANTVLLEVFEVV